MVGKLNRLRSQPGPATVLVIGLLGFAFGPAILYFDWPFPDETRAFTSTGEYALWLFLFAAQTALWALALLPLTASLNALWRFSKNNWRGVIVSTGSVALALLLIAVGTLFISTSFPEINYPFSSHGVKLTVLRDSAVGGRAANESWTEWHERRREFEDVLGVQATASATFRSGVAILTPLARGLLGLLFDT